MTNVASCTSGSIGSVPIRCPSADGDLIDEAWQICEPRRHERWRCGGDFVKEPDQVHLAAIIQGLEPTWVDLAGNRLHDNFDQRSTPDLPHGIGQRADHGLSAIEEHRLLGREVVEYRLLGDLGRGRDLGHGHVVEPMNQEHRGRHIGDPLANLPLLAFAQALAGVAGVVVVGACEELKDGIHVEVVAVFPHAKTL